MKNIDKDEEFVSLSYEEMNKLRKKLFQCLSKENFWAASPRFHRRTPQRSISSGFNRC